MSEPTKIAIPWARDDGTKATIPETSQIGIADGRASFPDGFVPLNGTPKAAGGIPPFKQDMNGILYAITNVLKWTCSGGMFKRDATFQSAISGYPQGAVLLKSDNSGLWFNTVDSNTSNPDTGGAGWISIDPRMYADAGGTTTAYTATYSSAFTTLSDDLTVYLDTAAVGTNTTTTPTFSPNGLTAHTIVKQGGVALRLTELPTRAVLQYDLANTRWILLNPDLSASLTPVGSIVSVLTNVLPTGYLKCNGAAISRTTYSDLFKMLVTDVGFTAQTFTLVIGASTIFTKNSHGLNNGDSLRLSTTGALPTGLNTSTDYFVEKINDNTFYLTTSIYGVSTRISTSGTQSGTHSYTQSLFGLGDGSSTFNLPDFRGLFLRAWDDSRGIDSSRAIGTSQKGSLISVDTNTTGSGDGVWNVSVYASTVAQAQSFDGVDSYSTTDFPTTNICGQAPSSSQTLPGSSGSQCASGIARPSNIAVMYCIKY